MAQKQKFISRDWDYGRQRDEPRPPSREDEEQRRRDIDSGRAAPSFPSSTVPRESQTSYVERAFDDMANLSSIFPPGSVQRQLLSSTQFPIDADLGSLLRFGKAAVVEPVKGLWDLGGQLVEDPGGTIGGMAKGILSPDPYMEQWGKAQSAMGRGEIPQAIGHGIAGSVPLVGPSIGGTVERASETGDTATAMGELSQFLIPGPKGLRFKPRTMGRIPLTFAERHLGGMVGAATGWVEGVLERTLAGAPIFRKFRRQQHEAMTEHADDLMRSLDPTTRSLEEVGQNLINSLKVVSDRRQKTGKALYDAVWPRAVKSGVEVNMAPVKEIAKGVKRELELGRDLVPDKAATEALEIVEKLLEGPATAAFEDLNKARSVLLGQAGHYQAGGMVKQNVSAYKRLAASMHDAMEASAKAAGDEGVYTAWRRAQDYNKATRDQIDSKFVKGLLALSDDIGSGSEKVARAIERADKGRVRRLWEVVPEKERNSVRAALVKGYLEKAGTGELGTVASTGVRGALEKAVDVTTVPRQKFDRELSGTALRKAMEKEGSERLEIVLGKETSDDLLRIAEDAARIGSREIDVAPGLVAAGLNATMMAPFLNLLSIGTIPFTGPRAAATAAGITILSSLLVHQPKAMPLYKRFLARLSQRDVRGAVVIGLQLQEIMKAEEARIQQDEKRERSFSQIVPPPGPIRDEQEQSAVDWFEQNPPSAFDPQITPVPQQPQGPRTGPPRR